jgi:hypothetical protein
VARIDAALGTRLRYYRPAGKVNAATYRLRANDRPLTVPAALAGDILGVTGLDNAAPLLPLERPRGVRSRTAAKATAANTPKCSHYYGQHVVTGLPGFLGTTTFPITGCGYSARQLRGAYHVSGTRSGAGQTIALTALGLNKRMFLLLRDYAKANDMPAPSAARFTEVSLGGGNLGQGPVRSVPDISADADSFTGLALGLLRLPTQGPPTFFQRPTGGTSLAAPLVAGMVTAAQQGQRTPFGFTNPALYKLAATRALTDPLPLTSHSPRRWRAQVCTAAACGIPLLLTLNDQDPTLQGYDGQVTLPGYDNMTGIGVPDWPRFIPALRALERG